MRTLHDALDETLERIPEKILGNLLAKKLEAQGITLSPRERRNLENYIRSGESKTLRLKRWRWWKQENIILDFKDEEILKIEKRLDEVLEKLPQLIWHIINELSTKILTRLKRGWRTELRRQSRDYTNFQKRLLAHWALPLDLLKMLLTISREHGAKLNQQLRQAPPADSVHLVEVLTRLHGRACQVVNEILVLLSAGFADGAMARWRTLHEISVIALFIGEYGEELAERYILHQHVESKRAMSAYNTCQEYLEYEPLEIDEIKNVERLYMDVVDRFGKPFGEQYGWAAHQLNSNKPKFADIEKAVGISHYRAHYRMASHNVHANPKGVFFKLGLLEEVETILAGPSNTGLADPGHGAAISLVETSTPLALLHPTLDNIVTLKIMEDLADEIGQAFGDAHKKLLDNCG